MHSSSLDSRELLQAFSKAYGRIAVVGNRDFQRWEWVVSFIGLVPADWTILSRGCAGVDSWVEDIAQAAERKFEARLPDWARHYRMAPLARNRLLIDEVDWIVAFWDGASTSLNDLLGKARKTRKLLHTFVDDSS
jgi:hypothetical protein